MINYADRTSNRFKEATVAPVSQRNVQGKSAVQFIRPGASNLQAIVNNSPKVKQMQTLQTMANDYSRDRVLQRISISGTGAVIQRVLLRAASGAGDTRKKKIITSTGFDTNHLIDGDITDDIALARKAARGASIKKNTVVKKSALLAKIGDSNPPVDGKTVTYSGFGDAEAKNVLSPSTGAAVRAFPARSITLLAGPGLRGGIKLFHLDSAGQDIIGDGAEFPALSSSRVAAPATSVSVTTGVGAGTPSGEPVMTATARKKLRKKLELERLAAGKPKSE